jgi:hypothetical protein
MEGENPEVPFNCAVGRKDRWPSKLNTLRPLFYRVKYDKCPISDRVIRTILYLNRLANGNGTPDISEVIKPSGIDPQIIERFEQYVRSQFGAENGFKPYVGELIARPHTRIISAGPNSKPK